MDCTRNFFGIRWAHHTWHRHVTSYETLVGPEANMWAQVKYKEFVRCDKQDVCTVCGKVRREVSCMCDATRAERCKLLLDSIAESRQPAKIG